MDCAPFKKPSRKAGLFSYRSAIPPSPHEILPAQIFMGTPPPCGRQSASFISCAAAFLQKSPRAHSAAPRFPAKLCFANFRGDPRRPVGGNRKVRFAPMRFYAVSTKSVIRPLPCTSFSPRPTRVARRLRFAVCFLTRGRRICYAVSQIIRKGSVTRKAMDDGDSTGGETPPLSHIQSFIGHSLCLRE